jgi:hypothetical protein
MGFFFERKVPVEDIRGNAGYLLSIPSRLVVLLICSLLLASCGGRAFVHESLDSTDVRNRAEPQSRGPVRVSAAVPGREETVAIFGIALYDQGIQPVWLEIENTGSEQIRYAPVSTDRLYFSPFEVAYKNRGGYSDEARVAMERRFNDLAMPRYVDPGETRSGFIFTHADFGAKGFNVDIFGPEELFSFTFLLRVPGFEPDYANIDFDSIYAAGEITDYVGEELYRALKSLPCCSEDENGNEDGEPVNIVLISEGPDLLRAMLRSNWIETSAKDAASRGSNFLFGRKQDAIFRYYSFGGDSVYELRLWLAPFTSGQDRIWVGQVSHFFTLGTAKARFDPDVDTARNFALQNFFYGRTLAQLGWVSGEHVMPADSFWANLDQQRYFTDGYRIILRLSGKPVSMVDSESMDWDNPPGWRH